MNLFYYVFVSFSQQPMTALYEKKKLGTKALLDTCLSGGSGVLIFGGYQLFHLRWGIKTIFSAYSH